MAQPMPTQPLLNNTPWGCPSRCTLPGVLILLFYVVTAPLAVRLGFPPGTALFVSIAAILIPFELGYLFYQGRNERNIFIERHRILPRANALVALHRTRISPSSCGWA